LAGTETINLLGNHEQMMLAALGLLPPGFADDEAEHAVINWLYNGGEASLRSWGLTPADPPSVWRARIPAAHLAFLRSLRLQHRVGPYLFVHAGLRPGVPLGRQSPHDQTWIREPFLSWTGDLKVGEPGLVVVHGHTPVAAPVVKPHRIGIDTGAVAGGALTCLVLEGERMGFLSIPA
jgi:serine/threonine protein phosphatase 1